MEAKTKKIPLHQMMVKCLTCQSIELTRVNIHYESLFEYINVWKPVKSEKRKIEINNKNGENGKNKSNL